MRAVESLRGLATVTTVRGQQGLANSHECLKRIKILHNFCGLTNHIVALGSISASLPLTLWWMISELGQKAACSAAFSPQNCSQLAGELKLDREKQDPITILTKGNKSCQCSWAIAPCEVIIIHEQLSGLLLWETRKVRQRARERRKRESAEWNTLRSLPYCEPTLPCSHRLHHCCPPCCRVITFLQKMRFAVPRRLMIPFNLSYWSTPIQNSNQAFFVSALWRPLISYV